MKAAVVTDFTQPLELQDRPIPEPGPGQVLVRMETCGLCHTDIHAAHGDWPVKPTPPFVPGHEGVGIIERTGEGTFRAQFLGAARLVREGQELEELVGAIRFNGYYPWIASGEEIAHDLRPFLGLQRAGAIDQLTPRLHQLGRPCDQPALQGYKRGNIGFALDPGNVGVTPNRAGR